MSCDDGKDGQGWTKTVLVDEKYLKKREKQLKKLRASLKYACDERNKDAIDEALARAERKQMTHALKNEIKHANNVLLKMQQRLGGCTILHLPHKLHKVLSQDLNIYTQTRRHHLDLRKVPAPSLVIRPIAYGQALQASKQHQQQLRAYQKLIQE
ncbi:hypothetical protein PsorP6_006437 [Peronosclerospora sorghi]|uniref:Uncharacterized protein n=1 Tax=Peronosclerospora sorghi TaxID=230839 RepID=A0ACC0W3C0_9STRA|nr:hypothetical protein PsorP6_006437 [Peronosclerospora sorghi]